MPLRRQRSCLVRVQLNRRLPSIALNVKRLHRLIHLESHLVQDCAVLALSCSLKTHSKRPIKSYVKTLFQAGRARLAKRPRQFSKKRPRVAVGGAESNYQAPGCRLLVGDLGFWLLPPTMTKSPSHSCTLGSLAACDALKSETSAELTAPRTRGRCSFMSEDRIVAESWTNDSMPKHFPALADSKTQIDKTENQDNPPKLPSGGNIFEFEVFRPCHASTC